MGRHLLWCNFELGSPKFEKRGNFDNIEGLCEKLGYNKDELKKVDKIRVLRNCVEPEVGAYILEKVGEEILYE